MDSESDTQKAFYDETRFGFTGDFTVISPVSAFTGGLR
jgi:hypothetical protein